MANSGPNTNQAQFFITYRAQPSLDRKYTVFGHVIHGMDTLDRMEKAEVNEKDRPNVDILITGCTIHANPFAAKA